MFKMKGRWLGQEPVSTKNGKGYIRRLLAGEDVYTVYSQDASKLAGSGEVEIPVRVQDFVFAA